MSEWPIVSIQDIGQIVTGKTPPTSDAENFGGDIPFVTPSDMHGARFVLTTSRTLSAKGAATVSKELLPVNSILVSCIGSDMGKAAITSKPCVTNQQINAIIANDQALPLYVYYNLSRRKAEIRSMASGSAQPILNKSGFGRLELVLPPIYIQRSIVDILGAIDDRIEIASKENETLEAMARAIFKSWFVDFDPVRAKAEGRTPEGMDAATAALFPSTFTDAPLGSPLGPIPEGWAYKRLDELFDVSIGRTPPRKEHHHFVQSGQGMSWLSIKDMAGLSVYAFSSDEDLLPQSVINGRVPVVPEDTVVVSFKLTVGRVAITAKEMCTNEAIAHLVPRKGSYIGSKYTYSYMSTYNYEQLGSTSSIATAVNSQSIRSIQFLEPSEAIHRAYLAATGGLFEKIKANSQHLAALAQLRGLLLPRLISGQIRIGDAI